MSATGSATTSSALIVAGDNHLIEVTRRQRNSWRDLQRAPAGDATAPPSLLTLTKSVALDRRTETRAVSSPRR
jgi:hypothetical protein